MKPAHRLALLLLVMVGLTPLQAQTPKTTPPSKKSIPATQKNSRQGQLPFADARNVTVIILWRPPQPAPAMPSTFSGPPITLGSGVWIGKEGYIATCEHVIANWPSPFRIGIAREPYVAEDPFKISVSGVVNTISAVLVASDPDTDVAIIKAKQPPDQVRPGPVIAGNVPPSITPQEPITPKGATLKTAVPERGETLLLAGFPLPEETTNTLVLQTAVATGLQSRPKTETSPFSSGVRLMLSVVSNPGNSGGPVLDADGKVVGLLEGNLLSYVAANQGGVNYVEYCSWARIGANGQHILDPSVPPQPCKQNSGISFAVPAKFIVDLAKKNNINLD